MGIPCSFGLPDGCRMTDAEMRSKMKDAGMLVGYCRNIPSSNKVGFTSANLAANLMREVPDEFKRRIEADGGKVNNGP